MLMLLAIDFDGTLADKDTVDWFCAHYAPTVFEEVDAAFARGEITLDETLARQVAPITATEDEVVAFLIETVTVRPGVPELLAFCDLHDIEAVIVSSGFDNLMHPYLQAHGYDLPIYAHSVTFGPEGMRVQLRGRAECDLCGVACKRAEVRDIAAGRSIAYVGDGPSDLCAAEDADIRFARASLAEHLEQEGYAYVPFENFHDVRLGLATALGVAP